MSFEADEEILQDFLVEAGEILELLSEQLVELESRPEDMDLLNAIFRGFHTVKGGAGFLQLNELVECCHISENVFDILRKGERQVTPELMDVVLEALDNVNSMFNQVRERTEVTPAPPELLEQLAILAKPASAAEDVAEPDAAAPQAPAEDMDAADLEFEQMLAMSTPEQPEPAPSNADDLITEEEFEALLDQLHGSGQGTANATGSGPAQTSSDEITDDEFESLLDQLHGEGKFGAVAPTTTATSTANTTQQASSDEITDDEFEDLLDQLHGKGRFQAKSVSPAVDAKATVAPKVAAPTATPEKPAAAKPAPAKPKAAAPAPARNAPVAHPEETTVRVDTARLDDIMNMVGELVLVRNRLVRLGLDSEMRTWVKPFLIWMW